MSSAPSTQPVPPGAPDVAVPPSPDERAAARRGSYAKGRATREVIIQAAIGLFGEVGYNGASLRDIAARAEISHPGLLHHFATKDALLAAVLAYRDEVDSADLAEDMAQGRGYLEAMLRLVARNEKRRPVVELYAALSGEATSPEHPAHAFFVSRYEFMVRRCTEAFAELAGEHRLRPGVDPSWAARTFIALMDGLQIQWLLSFDGPSEGRVGMVGALEEFLALITRPGR